jgi:hypothetical protein
MPIRTAETTSTGNYATTIKFKTMTEELPVLGAATVKPQTNCSHKVNRHHRLPSPHHWLEERPWNFINRWHGRTKITKQHKISPSNPPTYYR